MLTDSGVHAAKSREKRYKLTDSRGLYLLVTPQGGRYWRLKFRLDGKERLMSLGVYPDVSLQTARLHRDKMRAQIAAGVDPLEARGTKRARTVPADAGQMEPQLDKVQRIGSEPARQAFQLSLSETGELRIANFHQSIRLTAQHTEALRAFLLAELEARRNRHAAD